MKRIFSLIPLLLMVVACNNYQQTEGDFSSTLSESSVTHYSSPRDAAPVIARTFVKRYFSTDCKFDHDVVLENTLVDQRYQVMQKFKSKGQEYVFKIFIQYFDGDVNDLDSWEFGQLVVENASSGNQDFYTGNLDDRIKKSVGIGNMVTFAEVDFKIIDARIGTSIAFAHKGNLSSKQISAALKEMHKTYGYENYHLYHENDLGKDYFCWIATGNMSGVFDYERNKIYENLDSYEQGKPLN